MLRSDARLEGRVSVSKTRHGDERRIYKLTLTGQDVYEMQDLFERCAEESRDYFHIRAAVLLAETLREAVKRASEEGPPGGTNG